MGQINLATDREMDHVLDELQSYFRASTKTELLRRAIAFMEIVKQVEETGGTMAMLDQDEKLHRLLLSLRPSTVRRAPVSPRKHPTQNPDATPA